MQEKAQVFALEDNAAVRSRLTHSLEVAHIGRYLTQEVLEKAKDSNLKRIGIKNDDDAEAATTIVEVACMLHDIGNPPFGHFGEKVIRHWFENNKKEFQKPLMSGSVDTNKELEFTKLYQDFSQFDGNPQGFRIVSKLQWNHDENGLNLTASQLASLLKYDCSPEGIDCKAPSKKKAGYFFSDEHVIASVWDRLKMKHIRHPLSYLMEAADDLAYCLSDIEDGLEKGLLTGLNIYNELASSGSSIIKEISKELSYTNSIKENKLHDLQTFLKIRTKVINSLVSILSDRFIDNIPSIIKNSTSSLVELSYESKEVLSVFRTLANRHLYNSRAVRENEIIANRVITGLLDAFKPLLICDKDRFNDIRSLNSEDKKGNSISVEQALYKQFSSKYIRVYDSDTNNESNRDITPCVREWMARAHLIIDQISGMTDGHALKRFRLICSP
ncbi:hypothetical protein BTA51_03585 [Hahella sp. CCB-MM4]|nr:hypothetical protein BTA51_03585 [Hahella sp. CCB-MM4]